MRLFLVALRAFHSILGLLHNCQAEWICMHQVYLASLGSQIRYSISQLMGTASPFSNISTLLASLQKRSTKTILQGDKSKWCKKINDYRNTVRTVYGPYSRIRANTAKQKAKGLWSIWHSRCSRNKDTALKMDIRICRSVLFVIGLIPLTFSSSSGQS